MTCKRIFMGCRTVCMSLITDSFANWNIGHEHRWLCLGSAFDMGMDMLWHFTFLKKCQFHCVILLDPSNQQSGRTVITFPIMFSWWLNILYSYCITLLNRVEVILLCHPGITLMKACLMALWCSTIQGVARREYVVKEGSHDVDDEAGVVLGIDQSLGNWTILEINVSWTTRHCGKFSINVRNGCC